MTTQSQTNARGFEARPPEQRAPRTPAEIEADIEHTRARLAVTVDAITERVKPANVARRLAGRLKAQVVDERGHIRTRRVAAVSVGVVAVAGLMVWRRTR